MTIIVALSGKKQSGKTSLSNYLHGHEMQRHDVVKKFFLSPEGNLVVNCTFQDEKGNDFEEMGVLDLQQRNDNFYRYAAKNIWPLIRAYNFADALKEMCVMLFNIPPECVYGTDEQKNQLQEHLLWENMPGVITYDSGAKRLSQALSKHFTPNSSMGREGGDLDVIAAMGLQLKNEGPMTAREFMQYFGTDIMRKMYEPIWVNACIKKIQQEQSGLAIIADVRFPNEAKAIEQAGGKVVRLTREVHEDNHSSEVALDDYPFTDYIDNKIESIDILMVKVKEFYRNLKESYASNLC